MPGGKWTPLRNRTVREERGAWLLEKKAPVRASEMASSRSVAAAAPFSQTARTLPGRSETAITCVESAIASPACRTTASTSAAVSVSAALGGGAARTPRGSKGSSAKRSGAERGSKAATGEGRNSAESLARAIATRAYCVLPRALSTDGRKERPSKPRTHRRPGAEPAEELGPGRRCRNQLLRTGDDVEAGR